MRFAQPKAWVRVVLMAHLCLSAHAAAAQENVSVEVRLETPGTVQRFSHGEPPVDYWLDDYHEQSTHPVFGGGVRVFGPEGRGALLDVQSLPDPDYDAILDESGSGAIDLLVAHVGFARRYELPARKVHRAIAITPHVAAAVGHATCSFAETICTRPDERVGVFGLRVGVDFDFHFRRIFVGFGLRYGLLFHREGVGLDVSHLLGFGFFPRFGFVLGKRITKPPDWSPSRNGLIGL